MRRLLIRPALVLVPRPSFPLRRGPLMSFAVRVPPLRNTSTQDLATRLVIESAAMEEAAADTAHRVAHLESASIRLQQGDDPESSSSLADAARRAEEAEYRLAASEAAAREELERQSALAAQALLDEQRMAAELLSAMEGAFQKVRRKILLTSL